MEEVKAQSSEHFSKLELQCQCGCETCEMDALFLERLEAVRKAFSKSMPVTSGYRCSNHPIEKAKLHGDSQKPTGMHPQGRAVDVAVSGADALTLIQIALQQGMKGVGVCQKGTGRFIHLDDRDGVPAIWSY